MQRAVPYLSQGEDTRHLTKDEGRQALPPSRPVLNLPTTLKRRASALQQSVATYAFRLEGDFSRQIKGLEEGTTLDSLFLTAFQLLLYRYTAQEDIAVALAPLTGPSEDVRLLRVEFSHSPSVPLSGRELLAQVSQGIQVAPPAGEGGGEVVVNI